MRMHAKRGAGLVGLLLTAAAFPAAAEQAVRAGVVSAIQPVAVEAAAVSTSTRRQLGGMLGRALGEAAGVRGSQAYELTRVAGNLGADLAGGNGGGPPAGAKVLLVVDFDDASTSAFTRGAAQAGRFRVGSRVKVVGAGDDAVLLAE